MGLEWTDPEPLAADKVRNVTAGAGLYLLADARSQEIIYIGQSADVAKRLLDHSRKTWDNKALKFSYSIIRQVIGPGGREEPAGFFEVGQSVLPHNLKELENDLIGNYFENFRKAPEFQFRNSR